MMGPAVMRGRISGFVVGKSAPKRAVGQTTRMGPIYR
jgi:hypothetical protein